MAIKIDRRFLQKTLVDLVQINSVNPSLDSGSLGEAEIARYLLRILQEMGLQVDLPEPQTGRTSVAGMLTCGAGGRTLMLNAHIDTVGVEGMPRPFSAEIREGKLFGRGAYDMKGSVAACVAAAKALRDADLDLHGTLLLALVADEEYESLGTRHIVQEYHPDAAIVTEPTQLQLCLAHKGFTWLQVDTHGKAAHGSRFDEGIDANMMMGRFLAELDELERSLRRRAPHPLVGPPSLHAAVIRGGTGLSTYARQCTLQIERRTIPGESQAEVEREIDEIFRRLENKDSFFKATRKTLCVREPFEISPDAEIVQIVCEAAAGVLGKGPAIVGETPWMDAAILAAEGIQTVVFGPAGAGAHAVEEWVDLQSVEKLAEVLAHCAVQFFSQAG